MKKTRNISKLRLCTSESSALNSHNFDGKPPTKETIKMSKKRQCGLLQNEKEVKKLDMLESEKQTDAIVSPHAGIGMNQTSENLSSYHGFIPCSLEMLQIDMVLPAGQSFRYGTFKWEWYLKKVIAPTKKDESSLSRLKTGNLPCIITNDYARWSKVNNGIWRGIIGHHQISGHSLWTLCQKNEKLYYHCHTHDLDNNVMKDILTDYFNLKIPLGELYTAWTKVDKQFAKTALKFKGIRILRQDPVENLFSFIISTNNNISRITSLVEKLCKEYGEVIFKSGDELYYSFPAISSLSQSGVEEKLRDLGFGYRAKFISKTANMLLERGGEEWLFSLRSKPYEEVHQALVQLNGVGAKVADCVSLMSLDKHNAVPIDTHVWQFVCRHYIPKAKSTKSITDKIYKETGDYLRDIWGEYAGWAQAVMFCAELRQFKEPAAKKRKT